MIFTKTANIPYQFCDRSKFSFIRYARYCGEKQQEKRRLWRFHFGPEGNSNQFLMVTELILTLSHPEFAYFTYAATDKLLYCRYMGTLDREVISPLANFHYSTSYLFTNGPFRAELNKLCYYLIKLVLW
jgi:hypothetical protein